MHQLDESLLEDGLLRACVYVVLCVYASIHAQRYLVNYFFPSTGLLCFNEGNHFL